ncbi:MAG: hypothetical protein ABIN97_11210 [Ginsengibacter sp.]
MNSIKKILYRPFFIRLFNWEYWPFNVVYGPVYLYWLWLCVRARSFFFFNAANPSIKNGGFLMESKKEIYDIIPQKYYPPTLFFKAGIDKDDLVNGLCKSKLQYPLIGKPDIGGRGRGVEKLEIINDVINYAQKSRADFLLQEYIPYNNEVGIFYYRYPSEDRGHISGIVAKEFLTLVGDGLRTMEELLKKDKRFILQLPSLQKSYGKKLERILMKGEECLLVPYGNHARGAKFIDISSLIDEQLVITIDKACKEIPGFYFGRMDIKYNTWQDLKDGKNFSIIEVNGAGSEPTHIYDPKHSIFFAWREIMRHLNILLKISMYNQKNRKIAYLSFKEGLKMLQENNEYGKLLLKDTKPVVDTVVSNLMQLA